MPRKQRRRPPPRRTRNTGEDAVERERRAEAAARTLLADTSPEQLRSQLLDRELLLDEADRAAQLDPNPMNLARYRAARAQVETVRRALNLMGANP
jgi:hypothetical protein